MVFYCDEVVSAQNFYIPLGDNNRLVFMSGVALTDFRATNRREADWNRDHMYIVLTYTRWQRVDGASAVASPNSFCQDSVCTMQDGL
jgi:hypothetical protein